MDYALFARTSRRLWAWVVAPAVLVVAVHVSSGLFCRQMNRALHQRAAVLNLLPDMRQSQERAEEAVRRFSSSVRSGTSEELGLRLNQTANRCGFAINELSVDKEGGGGGAGVLKARFTGDGTLPSIVQFIHDLRAPDLLQSVESVRLRAIRFESEPVYSTEFVFRWYAVGK